MAACGGMNLVNSSEPRWREPLRRANQRCPVPTMDIRDLTIDQAADENVVRIADCAGESEDLTAAGMGPPTPAKGLTHDRLDEGGHRPGRRLEDDAVLAHERNCLSWSHEFLPRQAQRPARARTLTRVESQGIKIPRSGLASTSSSASWNRPAEALGRASHYNVPGG